MTNTTDTNTTLTLKKTSKTVAISLLVTAIVGASSLPAAANKYRQYSNHSNNSAYDYAKVVNVEPVIETYEVNKPIEQCWDEQVSVRPRYRDNRVRSKTKTPEIVGAIIGGLIGNQVGKRGGGKARDVATVAGAVLGGSIGHDTKQKNRRYNDRYETTRYRTVQRCEMKDTYVTEEQVVGYDVEYKYRGNVFNTQMANHPGRKIKVKVTVNPA